MGADQLALVSGEPVRTGRADLAVVVDRWFLGGLDAGGARRTILRKFGRKIAVEDVGSVGEHG
jgi:hypothetical protein